MLSTRYSYGWLSPTTSLPILGINLEYKVNSGHPYTLSDGGMGQRAADAGCSIAPSGASTAR